ncbi:LysR family transcriptional regulator [Bosea beijingensis]|uniref:LysR family transcriptional regulator n=1 Tax=Bosea beijingensis TaxID=3068632 RepID=UPI0027407C0F|nr:LysR family transcriptional regulator [Bosea sp. REN20]
MSITLSQVRAFERVARLGSFHAAAKHVGITQPSISQRIKDLEHTLGVELFIRNGPRVSLSSDGHALLEHADRLLENADDMIMRFKRRDPLLGLLRIGVNESFGLVCLTDLMRRLERHYPKLKTSVIVGDTSKVSGLLNDHQLDLAVISEAGVASHVHRVPVGRNELAWMASGDIELPSGPLTPAQIAAHHLIVSPQTARLHTTMTNWFARAGVVPERVSTCDSLSVTILMIRSGFAIGLVPVRVVADELAQGRMVTIPVTPTIGAHEVSLCYQIAQLGPNLQAIVDLTRELIVHHQLFK